MRRSTALSSRISLVVVTFFVTLSLSQTALGLQCTSFLKAKSLKIKEAFVDKELTEDGFSVRDLNDPNISFSAYFESSMGSVFYSAYLSFPDQGYRSSISGSKAFDEMINHFGVENINQIVGLWSVSDNLLAYNKALEKGLSKKEAAFSTWSGKKAMEHGFSKLESIEASSTTDGQSVLIVTFEKPNAPEPTDRL